MDFSDIANVSMVAGQPRFSIEHRNFVFFDYAVLHGVTWYIGPVASVAKSKLNAVSFARVNAVVLTDPM